jgi:CDP-diacylglycerol--inositol 3-phosphatidyltransferase
MTSLFYIANIIGYVRVACLLTATYYSDITTPFLNFYFASYALDAVDGPVARALGGESILGHTLDMVTDRASSAVLLALLGREWLFFLILDISAHWVHFSSSLQTHESHKQVNDNFLLNWYYQRTNLFLLCLTNESYLIGCFLIKRGIPIPYLNILYPCFLLKQSISLIHLVRGCLKLSKI